VVADLRPLNDVVLVKLDPPDKLSDVIVTPDTVSGYTRKGTVLRVGPGRHKLTKAGTGKTKFVPTQLQPGDRIAFMAAAVDTQKANYTLDDDQALIREEDVLFTFEGNIKVQL